MFWKEQCIRYTGIIVHTPLHSSGAEAGILTGEMIQ